MRDLTKDNILVALRKKGYLFFSKPFKLNLVGIRSENSESDKFDDLMCALWTERGVIYMETFACTTDPGKHWLLNPLNAKGTAIMVPNQYVDAYKMGKHKGEYPALVQAAPMWFVRDNNKDSKLDFSLYRDPVKKKANAFFQVIGANIHRASAIKKSLNVGMYSAACQVVDTDESLSRILQLANNQINTGGGQNFTYTLLEEADVC